MDNLFTSKSLEDTASYARQFLHEILPQKDLATVVVLSGDLGAGKTAFTKELGSLLGIPSQEITSPTFVIEKIYEIKNDIFERFIHIDAYRLDSSLELLSLGWDDIVKNPKNLIVIEWGERVCGIFPKKIYELHFTFVDEDTRTIKRIS